MSSPPSPTHPAPPQNGPQPPNTVNSSLGAALQPADPRPVETPQPTRKRKKNDEDGGSPAEPRRLRRSHEACTRCRAKKIKCDSKHPRCTACATAGVLCAQEDRHRNTLTPRGHLDRVEIQLAQCQLLLKRQNPAFDLADLDTILAREGIEPGPSHPANNGGYSFAPYSQDPKQMPVYGPPGVPVHGFGPPAVYSYPPSFNPHIHPAFQQIQYPQPPPPPPAQPPTPDAQAPPASRPGPVKIKGQDPNSNDMSNTHALATNFGVSPEIVSVISANTVDKEDLAVGSSGLTSGRDRSIHEASVPRDSANWVTVTVRRGSNPLLSPRTSPPSDPDLPPGAMDIWLPKDRKMVAAIVEVYFSRLNIHRPVFARHDFDKALEDLYSGQMAADANPQHDPGFLCSLLPRPHLVALRPGRTLWRLVGSLPDQSYNQAAACSLEEECVLAHQVVGHPCLCTTAGTSILLGRPLSHRTLRLQHASAPRGPMSNRHDDFSLHFELSHPIAEIQADISQVALLAHAPEGRRDHAQRDAHHQELLRVTQKPARRSTRDHRDDEASSELNYESRHKALIHAIVTAHNVIIVHSQLIRFPDIAFFTSPIPLHIAAMVILYGHMSNCERLPRQTAIEDVWLALDMLPRFRWRWERKDFNGGHPLIFELASHHTSPTPTNAYPPPTPYGPQPRNTMNGNGVMPNGSKLVEIPTGLFYPFYPDENHNPTAPPAANGAPQEHGYGHILAAAATHGQHGSYGGQGSHDTFISEERNPTMHRMQWMNGARPPHPAYAVAPST
ncbi:hypothetical protein C8J57DRAFT_1709180 [Mycena rebaudengoi]|nr:hypothetical protein C8J57DRAFT_1709180 [Mycena rebaudengoi]